MSPGLGGGHGLDSQAQHQLDHPSRSAVVFVEGAVGLRVSIKFCFRVCFVLSGFQGSGGLGCHGLRVLGISGLACGRRVGGGGGGRGGSR